MHTSRRTFLQKVAGAAAGITALGAAVRPRHAHAQQRQGGHDDEPFWESVRSRFTLSDTTIVMNAANLAPSPDSVIEAVVAATRDIEADASAQNRTKYASIRESVRDRIAAFVGASANEIALVRNASEANSIVVKGLPLGSGDEVVIFDQNHESNNVAWTVRAARDGFSIRKVGIEHAPASPGELVDLFVGAIGPATKVLTFSDISNTSGLKLPVREICRAARERGVFIHVDGAQSLGSVALDLHDLGCDSYAASAHKWLMGPKEVGVLYLRADRVEGVWPGVVSQEWGDGAGTVMEGARKYECLGQRNDALIAGLAPTLDFYDELGVGAVVARVVELATSLKQELAEIPGVRMVTPTSPAMSAGVVVFDFPGRDSGRIYDLLYSGHGIAGSTKGGLRLCPHVYNTRTEVERAVTAVRAASTM